MKDIRGYEGLYSAMKEGKIWACPKYYWKARILKTWLIGQGYEMVMLYKNKKSKKFLVHRLIADTYIPNPLKLPQVNHKDGNKLNNRMENLEWCTRKQNVQHAIKSNRPFGLRRLKPKQVIEIRRIYAQGKTLQKELAHKYNIHQTVISDIVRRNIWNHVI